MKETDAGFIKKKFSLQLAYHNPRQRYLFQLQLSRSIISSCLLMSLPIMLRGLNKNVAESELTVFATPENSRFYSKMIYSTLDPIRLEIRLLQLHPQRLKPTDLPNVFPRWIRPGTDAYRLQEPTLKLLILDQGVAESIDIPSNLSKSIRNGACKQLIKPLPKGWKAVSFNSRKCSLIFSL